MAGFFKPVVEQIIKCIENQKRANTKVRTALAKALLQYADIVSRP